MTQIFTAKSIAEKLTHSLFRTQYHKTLGVLMGLIMFGLLGSSVYAQSPGLIFQPSTDLVGGVRPLDSNKDGYATTSGGVFVTNDETESEVPFRKIPAKNEPNSDLATGPSCGFTDFVQNTNKYSAATAFDGTYIFFRFRLGAFSPASKGYSILIDTDQLFGAADPSPNDTHGFEIEIEYVTNFGVRVYNVDNIPIGTNGTLIQTYPESQYSQKVIALTVECGNPDVFYDFFVPFSILQAAPFNITTSTPLRMVANTVQSTQGGLKGPISDIGGTEKSGIAGWEEMIDLQPGTSVSGLQSGAIIVATTAPVVTGPISDGATTVSGTSTEAPGTVITVYKNGVSIGTAVVTGGAWTLSGISPALITGQNITATALASGKTASALSNTVTVSCSYGGAAPTAFTVASVNSGKTVSITSTGNYANGDRLRVYFANSGAAPIIANTSNVVLNTTTQVPADGGLTLSPGQYCIRINGGGSSDFPVGCGNSGGPGTVGGSFWATYQASAASCESVISNIVCVNGTVTGLGTGGSVTIQTLVGTGSTIISGSLTIGTAGEGIGTYRVYLFSGTGTTPEVALGSVSVNIATLSTATAWSVTGISGSSVQSGKNIIAFVERSAAEKCFNTTAATRTVTAPNPSTPPVVTGPISTSATSIAGTSVEANGTIINVFKNGVSLGQTTVTGGAWTLLGVSGLLAGDKITATATAPGETVSGLSNEVTVIAPVSTKTANVVQISGIYIEGNTTVRVNFPSALVAGDIAKLYVDGVEIASFTATGALSTFDFTVALSVLDEFDAFALYASGVLSATITESGKSVSAIGTTQTVQCAPPDANKALVVNSPAVCNNSTASINLQSSVSGIIYELWNSANTSQIANSRVGNGGTITFQTIALTSAVTNVTIRAIKFGALSCTSNQARAISIDTYPPPTNQPLTPTLASPSTIALGTAATVVINPTEGADVTYTLYNKANDAVVSAATAGNSGSLSITTTATFTSNVDIYVIARKTYTVPDPDLVCDLRLTTEARFIVALPPTANPDINNTLPSTAVSGNLLTNDKNPSGGVLTINTTPVVGPSNGTLVINANGTYTYQPNAGFVGKDTFTYRVCSALTGLCSQAVAVINVYNTAANTTSANNAPVVHDDVVETVKNINVTGNALGNDFDPDAGQTLTVTALTNQAITGGSYSINASGVYTFIPTVGFVGSTSFDYTVCDSGTPQACKVATVKITVSEPAAAAANNAPFAQDDAIRTEVGVAFTATIANGLLVNDFDPDGNALTVNTTPVTVPRHGIVTLNTNGTYTYTPAAGYYGPDSFTYQVCDPGPLCDQATVYVMVQPRNPSPQADINNTLMNTAVSGNVLTNDLDPQGLALTVSTTTVTTANGTAVFNPNGTYTYTPNFGFNGKDVITYQACNSAGTCQNATLTIEVQKLLSDVPATQNNAPLANNDVGQTIAGVTLLGNVIVNDFDRDAGQTLTVSAVNGVGASVGNPIAITGGTLTLNSDGTYSFVPTAGFVGSTSFTYTITDNNGPPLTSIATVNLTVYPDHDALNNPPFAQDDAGFVFQNTTLIPTSLSKNVLSNDFDPEGTNPMPGTVSLVSGVSNGVLVLNANGTYTYTPTVGYTGPDRFTYRVCDAGSPALCDVATVYLTVQAIAPIPPVSRNDIANTLKNTAVVGPILKNDTDAYGLKLAVNPVPTVAPANGVAVFNADGTYTYTPTTGYVGKDSFTYEVCNSAGLCNNAVVSLNVVDPTTTVNVAPVVQNDGAETIQNNPVSGNVLANDFDYNSGDTFTVTQIIDPTFTSGSPIALTNGSLIMNSNGTYTFTPTPGFAGIQTFPYQTCDNASTPACATATVSITVYPTGTPSVPFAQNDAYVTDVGVAKTANVFGNDSNLGTVTSVTVTEQPAHGTLVGPTTSGDYTYTPNAGYSGPDYFVYNVCNVNGCSPATVSMLAFTPGGALPLDLLSFQATKQGETAKITWTTINEIEVSHFEIERSTNGQVFTKIGEQDARNAGIEVSNYVFIDAAPLTGANYYRFKQVEQDGKEFYSPMAYVDFAQSLVWSTYPNPTTDFVNIRLNVFQTKVQVSLLDVKGQSLQSTQAETDTEGKLRVDIRNLKAGAYYLQINVNGQKLNKMVVKY